MLPNSSTQQVSAPVQNSSQPAQSTQTLRISDVLLILVSNWYWILLSMFIAYGVSNWYLRRTKPTYSRKASILIKDMNKGNFFGGAAYGFSDASLMMQSVDLTNEEQYTNNHNYNQNNCTSSTTCYNANCITQDNYNSVSILVCTR